VGQSSSSVVAGSSSSAIAPTSSSAVLPPASSSAIAAKTVVDIDDVEDLDEVLKTTGTWYAYTDKEPGGKSTISNVYDNTLGGYVVVFPGTEDATNGTKGFVGLKDINWDQGAYTEAPFVALGLNMNADTSKGVDLSKCGAISYRYKGSAHTFKIQDGSVTDYAYHEYPFQDAKDWTVALMDIRDIAQPNWTDDPKDLNWAAIKKMAWEVIGYKGIVYQPTINYLYVDDLKCVELPSVGLKQVARVANGIKVGFYGDMLNVNFNKVGTARIQVFDMMGHVVESRVASVSAGANQFSLKNVANGNYVVRVMMNGAAKTARITIK
jgi:endoglucanase